MTPRLLTTDYAKNYCNWILIVKVIVENVVTCFYGTQCIICHVLCYNDGTDKNMLMRLKQA